MMITKAAALVIALLPAICNAGLFGPSGQEADHEWAVLKEVAADQHAKFTWVSDMDKWGEESHVEINVTGDEPYSGDCEEFMIASFNQARRRGLMTFPKHVKVAGEGHLIACGKFWCVDNLHQTPFIRPR